jgi:hypothetical protein
MDHENYQIKKSGPLRLKLNPVFVVEGEATREKMADENERRYFSQYPQPPALSEEDFQREHLTAGVKDDYLQSLEAYIDELEEFIRDVQKQEVRPGILFLFFSFFFVFFSFFFFLFSSVLPFMTIKFAGDLIRTIQKAAGSAERPRSADSNARRERQSSDI